MVLKTLENGIIGKWNYWKMELEGCNWEMELIGIKLNGVRNIERWSWKHWKMELETLETGIGNIEQLNWKQ